MGRVKSILEQCLVDFRVRSHRLSTTLELEDGDLNRSRLVLQDAEDCAHEQTAAAWQPSEFSIHVEIAPFHQLLDVSDQYGGSHVWMSRTLIWLTPMGWIMAWLLPVRVGRLRLRRRPRRKLVRLTAVIAMIPAEALTRHHQSYGQFAGVSMRRGHLSGQPGRPTPQPIRATTAPT